MPNQALGIIASGIEGGAKAQGSKLRQDAEDLRKRSFAKLSQEYSQQNTQFIDRLTRGRQAENRAAEIAREDKTYQRDIERQDVTRQQRIEDAGIIEGMKDKRGTTGKLFDDLKGIYGEEDAKQILKGSMSGKETRKGALTDKNKADLLMTLSEEYKASGAAGGGTPGKDYLRPWKDDVEAIPSQTIQEYAMTQPGWKQVAPMLFEGAVSGPSAMDIQGDELTASLLGGAMTEAKPLDTVPSHDETIDKSQKKGIIGGQQETPKAIKEQAQGIAEYSDDNQVKQLADKIGASKDDDLITKWWRQLKARLVELRSE